MQPNNGDTPNASHIPQNPNKIATEIINLLSVERFGGIKIFIRTPNNAPIITLTRLINIGSITWLKSIPPPEPDTDEAKAIEIAMLYANNPTTSSSATTSKLRA